MIPLFKPYMPQLPKLDEVLHSGMLAYGEYSKEFEQKLKNYFQTPYVLVTNSFETAVSVALATLDIQFGDEIIASPMVCLASTQPYLSCGAKIQWCDILPDKGTLSPDALRKTITPKTKAIVHNHFCGYPGYIDEINQIGQEYSIPVIDDGIECFGTEYKGKKIGNCGTDITVFSLNAVRFCTTIDGGIVIFKEKKAYEKAVLIRDCGIERSKFRDEMGEISPACDITLKGFSATMSNINGYIGSQQMDAIEEIISHHRENAKRWLSKLKDANDIDPIICDYGNPNYWVFGVLTENKRETLQMFRGDGYYVSGVHINNNIYSIFGDKKELKGVSEFYNHFLALPCGWWIDAMQI